MKARHLFLFGGSPPFNKKLGKRFTHYSLNDKGKVAILFIKRNGWKEYMPKYTCVLEDNGLTHFSYIPLTSTLDHTTIKELKTCTGIIICGGETELYRSFIVESLLGQHIKQMYQQGIPVAGFSAGALISPEACVIPPIDHSKHEHLFLDGLGLIKDCVISVHFSTWNEEDNLKFALEKMNIPIGYGIDDGSLYFKNGALIETESERFYKFERERS